ncbi:MAG TPA: hypothetical protein VHD33_06935 [Legionellaceae bacterium]|nr:hypothetical protein [Legionellaceae bacterium]
MPGILLDYEVMKQRVHTDPRFIAMRRYSYDIAKLEDRYDECPPHVIAQALLMNEEDVEKEKQRLILKLRNLMGIQV